MVTYYLSTLSDTSVYVTSNDPLLFLSQSQLQKRFCKNDSYCYLFLIKKNLIMKSQHVTTNKGVIYQRAIFLQLYNCLLYTSRCV